jgi:hypothetical protein
MVTKLQQKDALAKKHTKAAAAFFRAQKRMFTRRMRGKELSRELSERQFTIDEFDRIWADVESRTTPELKKMVTAMEADGLLTGANNFGLSMVGPFPDITFNLANPRAVAWFQQHGGSVAYIKGIQDTTADEMRTIIARGLDEGTAYSNIADEIVQRFGGYTDHRARLIAVTETGEAYEAGNKMFAETIIDDGVDLEKRWNNSGDDRVSDGCLQNSADGWIPFDDVHSSGHEHPLRFPGCRCWETYQRRRR